MEITKNKQDGRYEDRLLKIVEGSITKPSDEKKAEDISISGESVLHPTYTKVFDLAKADLQSKAVIDKYTTDRTQEERRHLAIIDSYITLFHEANKEDAASRIEKKLGQDESYEDIMKYASLEYANRISAKDKQRLIKRFQKQVDCIVEDYKGIRDSAVKEMVRSRMPNLENVISAKRSVDEKVKDNKDYGDLSSLVLKEFIEDAGRAAKKIGFVIAKYPLVGLIGLLPNEASKYLIRKLEDKRFLNPHDDNLYDALNASTAIEIATPVIVSASLALAYQNPSYLQGLVLIIPAIASGLMRDEGSRGNNIVGSPLVSIPYYVGKGIYFGAKGLFYDIPKKIFDSVKDYQDSLKRADNKEIWLEGKERE